MSLPRLGGAKAFVFSGIADHAAFVRTVRAQNVAVTGERVFPDHHAYDAAEIAEVLTTARVSGATVLITTEKDAVKVGPLIAAQRENSLPAYALRVGMAVEDEAAFFVRVEEALKMGEVQARGLKSTSG